MVCELSGVGFEAALNRETKAHMDRVQFLSLAFNAPSAFADHRRIIAALRLGGPHLAAGSTCGHLGKI